jgi:CheY-like chemotaxis protein
MESKPTVLIVDDDKNQLIIIRHILERGGFHVIEALNGDEALEAARSHRPDVMLIDIWMPGINGIDVIKTLREDEDVASIRVIAMSATSSHAEASESVRQSGADAYMLKPFKRQALLELIEAQLADER